MRDGWTKTVWGELATLEYGRALRTHQNTLGSVRVYGTNGPIGWHTEAQSEGPGVIIGRKGAYRGIQYSAGPFFVIDTAFYLKPKQNMNVRWAYYNLLLSDINSMDSGSAIPSTSRDEFYQIPVLVPPKRIQDAIASALGALDDKIELDRQMNETLEVLARTIFKSWFVDFDPVRAKSEGREPFGMDAAAAALFPGRFGVDGLPDGWRRVPLIDVCELKRGFDLPQRCRIPGRVPIYSSSGPTGWHIASAADAPGVVTGRYGTIGQVFFINEPFWPLNTTLYVRDFKGNEPRFVFYLLNDLEFSKYTDKAAVPGVNRNDIHREIITIPSLHLQHAFEEVVKPLWSMIQIHNEEHGTLASLRDLLLPPLMSGEIRVRTAEKVLEAAM